MSSRRTFIKNVSAIGLGSQLIGDCLSMKADSSSWEEVAELFFKDENNRLNFNTGSAGMMPIPIYNEYIKAVKQLASYAPYEVKQLADSAIKDSLSRIAKLLDCSDQNLALVRNTTEGINHILHGYPFQQHDEVIISNMAYPYPHYSLTNLEKKAGIKKVQVALDPLEDSDEDIVKKFLAQITANTRLIFISLMTFREGHILPVKAICDKAHEQGVEVIVDAAHAIGHFDHSIEDLGCDYYISSLHKWMYAPLGTGVLYIKDTHVNKIIPHDSYPAKLKSSMQKYNYTGTVAFQNAMTLRAVLDFHDALGISRKEARLKELASYLVDSIQDLPSIKIRTDLSKSVGVVSYEMPSVDYKMAVEEYDTKYGIHCKATSYKRVPFLRTTVNLHLTEKDIDRFSEATKAMTKGG